jgi:hypothetical protein
VRAPEPMASARGRELDPHVWIVSHKTSFVKQNQSYR